MKNLLLILTVIAVFSNSLNAQTEDCPCCTENHKGFDFWVGDWFVFDTLNNQIGENLILKLEDNCVVQENWKGLKGTTGSSYNYFNLQDSTWNQLWVDNKGSHLILKGKAEENKMILESEVIQGDEIEFYKNQIVWILNEDGSVTQTWNMIDFEGKFLITLFKGLYIKKSELLEPVKE